jgi:hypothetical protein
VKHEQTKPRRNTNSHGEKQAALVDLSAQEQEAQGSMKKESSWLPTSLATYAKMKKKPKRADLKPGI